MSLPPFRQKNALHVRMTLEEDAEHVINLAFKPVRCRPEGDRARQGLALSNQRLHPNALVSRKRIENPQHIEGLLSFGIVDRRDIHAIVKLLLVAQNLKNLRNQRAIY